MPQLASRKFFNRARIGKVYHDYWRGGDACGSGDVERFRAKMAGPTARRHSDRARTFFVLFSHRHLHRSEHYVERASIALLNFSALKAMRGRIALQKLRETDTGLFISHEVLWECGAPLHPFRNST